MKIVVVFKKSKLDLYEEHGSMDLVDPETMEGFKASHEANEATLNFVIETLGVLGVDWEPCYRADLSKERLRDKLVITVGGDGTVLDTSHYVEDSIMLGVNSDKERSVGFLCAANINNFKEIIDDVLSSKFKPAALARIEGDIDGKKLPFPVLNDLLVCSLNPAAVSRYEIGYGGVTEKHKSSGIWIATPVGSTAAIASAGGVKVPMEDSSIQFVVREPFNSDLERLGLTRGLVFTEMYLKSKMREGQVYLDGSYHKISFGMGKKLRVSANGPPLNLIVTEEMLKRRLGF